MVVYVVVAAVLASWWPLLTYSVSLALFGLTHVVVELRYVDRRFGRRFDASFWWLCLAPIAAIVLLRLLRMLHVIRDVALPAELVLVAATIVAGLWGLWLMRGRTDLGAVGVVVGGFVGVVLAGMLLVGAVVAPLPTILLLAIAHNGTPVGFLVERAPPGARVRALLVGLLVYVAVPALVGLGVVVSLVSMVSGHGPAVDATVLNTGQLRDQLGVYVLPSLVNSPAATGLFSAAVCAQLLHYGGVILWLPRTLTSSEQARLPWPATRWWLLLLAVAAMGLFAHFVYDFGGARGLYGLPAAVHAWLELPVILVGLSLATTTRQGPSQRTPHS